ncbi:hypothetical protein Tco_1356663, partial [Tanacetum coccineum]
MIMTFRPPFRSGSLQLPMTTEKSNAGGLNKRVKEKSLSSSTKLLEEVKDLKMEELEEDDTKALR